MVSLILIIDTLKEIRPHLEGIATGITDQPIFEYHLAKEIRPHLEGIATVFWLYLNQIIKPRRKSDLI